jgi:serine/threonine protein kinase/tetratricopeptide (TPR) repeat protein
LSEHLPDHDVPVANAGGPRDRLVEILERYLSGLEDGTPPDQKVILEAHPDLADELKPYLESLRLLDGATRALRAPKLAATEDGRDPSMSGPREIGDYRIVREIGRGGMGIVYEAHQQSLNRRVALKILPFAAVLNQRQIARFRNEAQAAAQLHHPHIVPVFAVGQEKGVYYYAMQYIEGQSLEQAIAEMRPHGQKSTTTSTETVDMAEPCAATLRSGPRATSQSKRSTARPDSFRTVARLGQQAASALHHAHEQGIVHRDVKPSNLLLDQDGKLWITDFGLAQVQNGNGVTLTGDVVGTLRYMSPEQANGSTLLDARTDVYSLGVTLYEFLAQQHAFSGDDRATLLRQIDTQEPTPLRKINPAIPLDLETIVLGAMAKSRDDRYASAQAMADDLERFLQGKPTLARRPTVVERAGKWARRHRSIVAVAACGTILVAIVSFVGALLLAREQARTSAALAAAEESLGRAERYFRQARSAVDELGAGISDRLQAIPGAEPLRRDLLVDTLRYYREFTREAGDDRQLRHETALAHFKSADIAAKLGAIDDAIKEYDTARKSLAILAETDSTQSGAQAQLALVHNNLGLLFAARGETVRARKEYEDAITLQRHLLSKQPKDPGVISQLAESQANLGLLLDQLGDARGAEQSLRGAVAVLEPLSDSKLGGPKSYRDLAIACNNLSFVLQTRDPAAAEQNARKAVDILERVVASSAAGAGYGDDLALCYNNLAALQSRSKNWSGAIASHGKAIQLQEELSRKSPGIVRHRSELAISFNNLGVAYCRAGQATEADAAFQQARALFTTLAKDYPSELGYQSSLAAQLNNQALALAGAGRHADALPIYRAAIQAQKGCRERAPGSELTREVLGKIYYNYEQSLRSEKRLQQAVDAALARRDLWHGNGEHLLAVAAELADLHSDVRNKADGPREIEPLNLELDVLTTLQQAYDSGWPKHVDLQSERFASFRQNERFAAKISELNEHSANAIQDPSNRGASTNPN